MFSFVAFELKKKRKCMLKFEFKKQFHVKDNKLEFSFHFIKVSKWFGGENLGAFPQVLGSNLDECMH